MDNFSNPPTKDEVDDFIRAKQTEYTELNFRDYDLWESFLKDFQGFTKATFLIPSNNTLKSFRAFLQYKGVWIRKDRITIAKSLFYTFEEKELIKWTKVKVKKLLFN